MRVGVLQRFRIYRQHFSLAVTCAWSMSIPRLTFSSITTTIGRDWLSDQASEVRESEGTAPVQAVGT